MAASTAAPRSTPAIERPEPLPAFSPSSAITIAGRPSLSFSRPATMPITPGCQPSPATTATARSGWASAIASALSQTEASIARRSSLRRSSSAAIARASSGSSVVSSRTPRSDLPTLPPALMRGPSAKPRSVAVGARESREASIRAASPTLRRPAMILRPCVTNARLRPLSWATSATVPSATRSSSSIRRGSGLDSKKPSKRSLRSNAAPSRKQTPTAARWPWAAASSASSSRLGLTKACATGSALAHWW